MLRSKGIADPSHTPNPAKAPWYFLGLQEMLHYFPPVVAGVLVPTLVVIALVVIPYFNINIEAEGLFLKDRRSGAFGSSTSLRSAVLFSYCSSMYIVALVPTLIVAAVHDRWPRKVRRSRLRVSGAIWLPSRSPYWIMTWFLFELVVLTAVGTFFRGPGWSWVLPWRS